MDEVLRKAVAYLLQSIEELVDDLLLIELNWGQAVPPFESEPSDLDFQGAAWPVVFTDSELVLRRTLCRSRGGRAILIVAGGDSFEVPRDLRARASRHRVAPLGRRHRLHALTGRGWPAEVDYAGWRPSVERHFDFLVGSVDAAELTRFDVTRAELELRLVEAAFDLTVEGQATPQLLAALVSRHRRSVISPTELERSLLQGQLRLHQISDADIVLWAVEEAGRAELLARTGVMMGAEQRARLAPNWGDLNRLRALLVNKRKMAEQDAITCVTTLAVEALSHLHHETRKAIVRDAEQALGDVLPEGSYNPWFPSALEQEIERVARGLSARDMEALDQVDRLREHIFAAEYEARLAALEEMAALLHRWVGEKPAVGTLTSVPEWATWYARVGSHLDLTALKLMACQRRGTGIDDPIARLLKEFWHWRDDLNASFAGEFLEKYEAAVHDRDTGVFGIHRILDWVIAPLLQQDKRVLLLVVDGMGWPAFWHLLDQWAEQIPPAHIRQPQPALSLLPSVTSVSRKGLFLGALPTDRLDDEETYDRKARTGEAKALGQACRGHTVKLYNKTNLDGGQILNDIQFRGADLVAVILNAIDDDVKSTTATVRLPRLDDLAPLVSIVRGALAAGWEVLVTADHGYTWHLGKNLRQGHIVPGGGERFNPLEAGQTASKAAAVTKDPNIVRLQDGQRVALLIATGAYFGRMPRRGYHGGAGLEEVVVPCAFLTREKTSFRPEEEGRAQRTGEVEGLAPTDHVGRIVLTLPDGRVVPLDLPFVASPREVRLLQTLARYEQVSEAEFRRVLGTRRIFGPIAVLRERLAAEGLDYIEEIGSGPEGAVYRFRAEMLSQ